MARNRAADHHRQTREMQSTADPTSSIASRGTPGSQAEARIVLAAIQSLPDAYRETLSLRLVEGMTGPEIRTGLTAESVRVNLHRGMKLLRERLGENQARLVGGEGILPPPLPRRHRQTAGHRRRHRSATGSVRAEPARRSCCGGRLSRTLATLIRSEESFIAARVTPLPLSSRPERTRISSFAVLATTTFAALCRESRMHLINADGLDRKSGGA